MGAVVEPLILAPLADGVVFVAAAEIVSYKAAQLALERIEDTGARILGVVLNRAQTERHPYYYRHYYGQYASRYYGKKEASRPRAKSRVFMRSAPPTPRLGASAPAEVPGRRWLLPANSQGIGCFEIGWPPTRRKQGTRDSRRHA